MKRLASIAALAALLLTTAAWAQPATAPAKPVVKADPPDVLLAHIKPFITEETMLVGHADLLKVRPAALKAMVLEIAAKKGFKDADIKPQMDAAFAAMDQWLTAADTHGVRHVFLVFSLKPTPDILPFFVAPLEEGADVAALKRLVPAEFKTDVMHNALVAATGTTFTALKDLKPVDRPELAKALAISPDAGGRLMLIPPDYTRKILEELMPHAPKELNSVPATAFTRGILWATAAIDPPPDTQVHVHIQSATPADAADAHKLIAAALQWFTGHRDVQELKRASPDADLDALARALTPQVKGDALLLTLTHDELVKHASTLVPKVERARAQAKLVATSNLGRHILQAAIVHASNNKNAWPDDLQTLKKNQTVTDQLLANPRVPGKAVGWVYLKPTAEQLKKPDPTSILVLYEDNPDLDPVIGGFLDGHLETMTRERLNQLLKGREKP